ncbi:hypothetical protein VP01_592g5 [Puccinia sorghi]|uniref:Uncharacterized protein n=1 Tax=Puccinia sorghi TaxID=27349 RepID=A0A0L6UHN6_9BASI|nr:hypothetical protein VP01_592g5 [Puccinia sorghi]
METPGEFCQHYTWISECFFCGLQSNAWFNLNFFFPHTFNTVKHIEIVYFRLNVMTPPKKADLFLWGKKNSNDQNAFIFSPQKKTPRKPDVVPKIFKLILFGKDKLCNPHLAFWGWVSPSNPVGRILKKCFIHNLTIFSSLFTIVFSFIFINLFYFSQNLPERTYSDWRIHPILTLENMANQHIHFAMISKNHNIIIQISHFSHTPSTLPHSVFSITFIEVQCRGKCSSRMRQTDGYSNSDETWPKLYCLSFMVFFNFLSRFRNKIYLIQFFLNYYILPEELVGYYKFLPEGVSVVAEHVSLQWCFFLTSAVAQCRSPSFGITLSALEAISLQKKLAQLPAVDMQKVPGSFCCYSNHAPKLIHLPKILHRTTCGVCMEAWLEHAACQLHAFDQVFFEVFANSCNKYFSF